MKSFFSKGVWKNFQIKGVFGISPFSYPLVRRKKSPLKRRILLYRISKWYSLNVQSLITSNTNSHCSLEPRLRQLSTSCMCVTIEFIITLNNSIEQMNQKAYTFHNFLLVNVCSEIRIKVITVFDSIIVFVNRDAQRGEMQTLQSPPTFFHSEPNPICIFLTWSLIKKI